jgi:hypothetical protein
VDTHKQEGGRCLGHAPAGYTAEAPGQTQELSAAAAACAGGCVCVYGLGTNEIVVCSSQDSLASARLKKKKKKHEHVEAQPVECPPASLRQLPVLATVYALQEV